MKVTTQHPDYAASLAEWQLVRDCVQGERAVKLRRTEYLPAPDFTENASNRYDAYLLRAVFYPVTGRTLAGFVGTVFAKDPVVAVPAAMQPWMDDVDGCGTSLIQQAKQVFREAMALGRVGLLVDYPTVKAPTSLQAQREQQIRPTVALYPAESIVNWRSTVQNGVRKLSLVVLREMDYTAEQRYESRELVRYRVLYLDEQTGNYTVEVHEGQGAGEPRLVGPPVVPLDGTGKPWRTIPFTFVGSNNNDATVDPAPLADLSRLNIAHFRNSADFEDSVHVVGQPTPILAGLTEHWVANVLKGRLVLGSRSGVPLPEGGSATLLQAAPNTLCQTAMELKERQMVAIGARLVMQAVVQRTATEATAEAQSELSVLASVANNTAAAYKSALLWMAQFARLAGEPKFEFSRDYLRALMDAQTRAQLVAEWQAGVVSFTEVREGLRRAGVAFEEDAKVQAERDAGVDPMAQDDNANPAP